MGKKHNGDAKDRCAGGGFPHGAAASSRAGGASAGSAQVQKGVSDSRFWQVMAKIEEEGSGFGIHMTANQEELLERARAGLAARTSGKRLAHCLGVEKTAVALARLYGVDGYDARLAGLIHDWDKHLPAAEQLARIGETRLQVPAGLEPQVLPLLHGPLAAIDLAREFPQIPPRVLQAVARHTAGALGMTDLDMVIYIADMIEPRRDYENVETLRSMAGDASLRELYQAGYAQSMMSLFARGRYVYPSGVEVWNDLVTGSGR